MRQETATYNSLKVVPAQMVDATLVWSLLAGVWNPKVFLGRWFRGRTGRYLAGSTRLDAEQPAPLQSLEEFLFDVQALTARALRGIALPQVFVPVC
jgi:hypothetical protein